MGFLFYWIFDNLSILAKIKFLQSVDKDQASKRAAFFWLLGLVFSVILVFVEMYELKKNVELLKTELKNEGNDSKRNDIIKML